MKKKINFINLFCVSYLVLSIFVLIFSALRFFKDFFKKAEDPINYFPNRKYGHYTPEAYKKNSRKIIINRTLNFLLFNLSYS